MVYEVQKELVGSHVIVLLFGWICLQLRRWSVPQDFEEGIL